VRREDDPASVRGKRGVVVKRRVGSQGPRTGAIGGGDEDVGVAGREGLERNGVVRRRLEFERREAGNAGDDDAARVTETPRDDNLRRTVYASICVEGLSAIACRMGGASLPRTRCAGFSYRAVRPPGFFMQRRSSYSATTDSQHAMASAEATSLTCRVNRVSYRRSQSTVRPAEATDA
jgi:hypothetical protein